MWKTAAKRSSATSLVSQNTDSAEYTQTFPLIFQTDHVDMVRLKVSTAKSLQTHLRNGLTPVKRHERKADGKYTGFWYLISLIFFWFAFRRPCTACTPIFRVRQRLWRRNRGLSR